MSKMLEHARAIGANYALIVHDSQGNGKSYKGYRRFYKRGSWQESRNCLLYWDHERERWDNSSEPSFTKIEYGLKVTGRKYDLIDFEKQERRSG